MHVRKVQVSGKTVDEAIALALNELGTTRDCVKVRVLEAPTRRLLGLLGARPARVEVEMLTDAAEETYLFLSDVIQEMGFPVEIEQYREKRALRFELVGENVGIYIGHRGQTLDALEYLLYLVANRYSDEHLTVHLDAEGYRKKREETLSRLAKKVARQVVQTSQTVSLEAMPAYERRIIHKALEKHPKVISYSKGNGSHRHVVISLREEARDIRAEGEMS